MKIIKLLLTIMFLSFAWVTYAQVTVGIPDTAVTGSGSINIPIKVTNFNDVGAISLKINYDPSVLTFQVEKDLLPGVFSENASNGQISISWYNVTTPLNLGNGTLINLKFTYTGVGTSSLVFNKAQSEITDSKGIAISTQSSFKDGSVFSAALQPVTFTLATQNYTTKGMDISVPVNVTNYNNIGATTLRVKYDPSVLTFKGLGNAPTGFQASASSGVITVSYTASSSFNFGNGKLLDLNFNYIGGNSVLQFAQKTVSNILGTALTVTSTDGGITGPAATTGNAALSIPDTNVSIYSSLNIPVNASNFTNIGSISLKINYNSSVLTFKGITNKATADNNWYVQANAAQGIITIGWSSPDGITPVNVINGKLFDLQFDFKEGSSTLAFNSNSEITNIYQSKIAVAFTNGSISAPRQISLGNLKANVGDTVRVPLTINNFKNIGSMSIQFSYDPKVVKYVGLENDSVGFTATTINGANGTINLGWSTTPPAVKPLSIVSGKLTNIKFVYIDNATPLNFAAASCQITDTALNTIANVNYISGSISKDISFELGKVRGNVGSDVNVPVKIKNITNIGSMSIKINFDPAKLTFKKIANFNGDPNKLQAYSVPGSGVLTVGYADVTPLNVLQSKVFDLVFTYNTSSTADITFAAGNLITDVTSAAITGITYVDGNITLNKRPAISGLAPKVGAEGSPLAFSLSATDPEADPVSISSANLPTGSTLTAKGAFAWTPAYNQAGTYSVKFTATDSIGAIDSTTVIMTIANTPQPVSFVTVLKDTTIKENVALTFKNKATSLDEITDGLVIKYKLVNAPATATIDSLTGNFAWTPDLKAGEINGGIYSFSILALGNGTQQAKADVKITVKDSTITPKFTVAMKDTTIAEASTLTFKYVATTTDPDTGKTIAYSLVGAPTGAAIDAKTGVFTWTPTYGTAKVYTLKVLASIGTLADTSKANITVTHTNRGPKFANKIDSIAIKENVAYSYTFTASDPDSGTVFAYSLSGAPTGAAINAATGAFAWTPTYAQSGAYTFKAIVSDGALKDTATVKITVIDVNRKPIFKDTLGNVSFPTISATSDTGKALTFTYTGTSPEGKTLYFFISKAPDTSKINVLTGAYEWNPGRGVLKVASYSIKIGLTDKTDTVYTTATITVTKPLGVMELGGIPKEYALSQNYPNPFNPSTIIRYSVPKESRVTVKVFNTIGQEVATLVDQFQSVGNYAINFDAKRLTSGIYIYRIQADKFVSVKKMILVK